MNELLIKKLRSADSLQIDCWCIGLYEDSDELAINDVGIQNIWIKLYDLINEFEQTTKTYVVEIETIANIANWKHGQAAVLDKLVLKPNYSIGEFMPIAEFSYKEKAVEYANKYYPYVDKTEMIMEHYNNV
ncbi:hypothetical protein ACOMCU_01635 [Lysinibacillus sp. UGB7]|uniref:hypothetical protein n=1 Tax=Lysinibacillus sp. UGB7 TaxID=3411039 RepID=UPI003B796F64